MLIINDLHIGVVRSGGTTPQSQRELRDYLLNGLRDLLYREDEEVTINGDLFDSFTVDASEVIEVAYIICNWLSSRANARINLIAGNHDWNPRGDKVSSFHLLCSMLNLSDKHGRVEVFDKGFARVSESVWCIPHMPNQEAFDAEIEKAFNDGMLASRKGLPAYLLLHCNYKNGFAENSDHSLNINDEQVGKLMTAGWTLIIGHEHIGYTLRGGRVLVVGNQFPSSIADCLIDPIKNAVKITDDGLQFVQTWCQPNNYVEIDWHDITVADLSRFQFIRVIGEATVLEAAEVIKAISKLRQTSEAFVIGNAVKIEGHDMSITTESVESIKAFDVVGAIMSELNEKEQEVVKGLLT